MKSKFLRTALSITAVLALGIGIHAVQIGFDTKELNTSLGTATIRGGLYTTYSNTEYSHMADTTTSIPISEGGTTMILARVVSSPAVTESRLGYVEVDAYGNTSSSTHEAWSDYDHKIIDIPPFRSVSTAE